MSTAWTMPYVRFDNAMPTGGIVVDLGRALSAQLGMPVRFVVLPPNRQDAASLAGDFDVKCYLNPQWTSVPAHFVWSPPLFALVDVIFGDDTRPPAMKLDAIPQGAAVSTVLGYAYPTIEAKFESKQLRRDDSPDQEKVMLKVGAGRTPYGISDALILQWHQLNTPHHRTSSWRLPVSRQDFQCAIPKNGKVPAARILAALKSLKKSGQMDAILQNYR